MNSSKASRAIAIAFGSLLSLCTGLASAQDFASAEDVQAAESACVEGDMEACKALQAYARSHCLNGNSAACSDAAEISQFMGQGQGNSYPGAVQDPLAPHRGIVDDSTDYIRSHCDDPDMAAQLRAYGFCR